jgi:long-subunit fatty acid transport protein
MKNRTLNKLSLTVCTASVLGIFVSSQVFAAGFEKSVFWSGHYSALAGAAQSSVTGPEALYWNPAGLAGSEGLQISGDFSPTLSKFSGNVPNGGAALLATSQGASPAVAQNTAQTNPKSISSNTSFTPVGAAFISYGITPQWGVGIGYDVVGGTRADYDSVDFGFPSGFITPPLKADLSITELSLGTGYEVMPGFKVGASYRVTFVHADLDVANSGAVGTNATFTSVQLAGLSQTTWNGFRVGAEYAPKDSPWGIGAVWRSRVNFNATGSASVQTTEDGPATGGTPVTGATNTGSGNVGGTLPMRLDAASHYTFSPAWTGFVGYSFTNYDQDQALNFGTTVASPLGGNVSGAVPLSWSNMHNIRGAVEYNGFDGTPIRFGYVWTSQVTAAGDANPTIASPGTGNTFVLGTAHKITPNLTLDAAFEYSRDSGSVAAADLNGGAATTATGDYSAKAYVLHLGATLAL